MAVISNFNSVIELCLTVTDDGANDRYGIDDSKTVPYSELQVADGGKESSL